MNPNAMPYAQVMTVRVIQIRLGIGSVKKRRYWRSSEALTRVLLMVKEPFER
jgi:hypothetical protein